MAEQLPDLHALGIIDAEGRGGSAHARSLPATPLSVGISRAPVQPVPSCQATPHCGCARVGRVSSSASELPEPIAHLVGSSSWCCSPTFRFCRSPRGNYIQSGIARTCISMPATKCGQPCAIRPLSTGMCELDPPVWVCAVPTQESFAGVSSRCSGLARPAASTHHASC